MSAVSFYIFLEYGKKKPKNLITLILEECKQSTLRFHTHNTCGFNLKISSLYFLELAPCPSEGNCHKENNA